MFVLIEQAGPQLVYFMVGNIACSERRKFFKYQVGFIICGFIDQPNQTALTSFPRCHPVLLRWIF